MKNKNEIKNFKIYIIIILSLIFIFFSIFRPKKKIIIHNESISNHSISLNNSKQNIFDNITKQNVIQNISKDNNIQNISNVNNYLNISKDNIFINNSKLQNISKDDNIQNSTSDNIFQNIPKDTIFLNNSKLQNISKDNNIQNISNDNNFPNISKFLDTSKDNNFHNISYDNNFQNISKIFNNSNITFPNDNIFQNIFKDNSSFQNNSKIQNLTNYTFIQNISKDNNFQKNSEVQNISNYTIFQNITKYNNYQKIIKDNTKYNISRKIKKHKYSDVLPKLNISDDDVIPNKKELFNSRELYINTNNITNKYIHYIRPINKRKEKKYKKKLYPGLEFNNPINMSRKGQYDAVDYYNLCNNGTLIDNKVYNLSKHPLVSLVIPAFDDEKHILRTIRSIQNQSFKNIEIIIIDDGSNDNSSIIYNHLLKTDPRIRIFYHKKNMGVWRSRIDGFLYSKGKYIQHFDMGDIYFDNYVLEDIFNIAYKYKLDSVRYSMYVVFKERVSHRNWRRIFPKEHTKIIYGEPNENLGIFGYSTIWNRLVRANIFVKGLDLLDHYVLNAYRNFAEDGWWNILTNKVSFSYLSINRLGYIYLINPGGVGALITDTSERQEKIIREFIYMWLLDYQLLPKKDNKKKIIQKLHDFSKSDNKVTNILVTLNFLRTEFPIYEHLLLTLLKDKYIENEDKKFINELLVNYTIFKNKKANESISI